jgi:hypothetical protein
MTTNQISTATNLQAPDLSNAQQDARKYFNNYFAGDFGVGAANDAITAYFEKYTGNAASGQALAAAVIYTARAQNIDPMQVFSDFQKLKSNELNNYLAAFLNFNRVPTSIIGIKSTSTTSPYITRSILL